jgi:hypothetical protein
MRPIQRCPLAKRRGHAYRYEDAGFARRQAFGLDDIAAYTHYAEDGAKTLFSEWVSLTEHNWVLC